MNQTGSERVRASLYTKSEVKHVENGARNKAIKLFFYQDKYW